MRTLLEIGEAIRTQDNRITDAPMFVVQERIRDYGYDSEYTDDSVWLDTLNDHTEPDDVAAIADLDYLDVEGIDTDGWVKVYYRDRWEFVTACFTERGCEDFIRANGHNLTDPRIYAAGSYRNEEFRLVRDYLRRRDR